jgi:hypothetical protein
MTVLTPLDVVLASPAAVAAHDRDAWLQLFARNHVVEDPVGSRPVVGGLWDRRSGDRRYGALGRFWDTFIGPNEVSFDVHHDIVDGLTVIRDVVIHTRTPAGPSVETPAHLVYELVEEDGGLRISRLAAHWEVWPVLRQLARPDAACAKAMIGNTTNLLRFQGPLATLAWMRSIHSVGEAGKTAALALVRAADCRDPGALDRLGGVVPADVHKVIAAGDTVTASCYVDGSPAVLVAYLNRKDRTVTRARVYR